jgi:predicted Zn-dependent protease with MMP-like domain
MAEKGGELQAWRGRKAPSLADFEGLAWEAYGRLPDTFRSLCEDLVIRIEDFPTEEVLETMGLESEFDLLGLFQGVGLPFQSPSNPQPLPNMIWLYRRPILDYWAEHRSPFRPVRRRYRRHRGSGGLKRRHP